MACGRYDHKSTPDRLSGHRISLKPRYYKVYVAVEVVLIYSTKFTQEIY